MNRGPINMDVNPHDPSPIEPLCCSFHYPKDQATEDASNADAAVLRAGRVLSDEVASKLLEVATSLDDVCQLWDDNDQAAWDASTTNIRNAFGFSLEEVVAEIRAFVAEAEA